MNKRPVTVPHLMRLPAICLTLLLAALSAAALGAQPEPTPAVAWQTGSNDKGATFDGVMPGIVLKDAHTRYNPADGFAVSARIKPLGFSRLAGIVSQYHGSKTGVWYLSLSPGPPHNRLWAVAVADGPKYVGLLSDNTVEPGKWYHVTLNFDGNTLVMLCDGKEVGRRAAAGPLLIHEGTPVVIGRQNTTFKGQIRDVRIYDEPLFKIESRGPAPTTKAKPYKNHIRNSSFEQGDNLADMRAWHRMTGSEYLVPPETGWQVSRDGAFHGNQCLKGDGAKPLWLPAEVWAKIPKESPWTFSVYLRAERDGVPCELKFSSYVQLKQEDRAAKVTLTQEWKRYQLTVKGLFAGKVRHGRVQGPANFWIRPLAKATLWADAVQWEPGLKPTPYSPSLRDMPIASNEFAPLNSPGIPPSKTPANNPKQTPGTIPIMVYHGGSRPATNAPVQVGVPFPAGRWNGQGSIQLSAANGNLPASQSEILSQRRGDGSVQSLGLYFEADLNPGMNRFTLSYNPSTTAPDPVPSPLSGEKWIVESGKVAVEIRPNSGALWEQVSDRNTGARLFARAAIRAVGLDGTVYDSLHAPHTLCLVEKRGGVHVSIVKRGLLSSADGKSILLYIARLHLWKNQPGVHVELTLSNSRGHDSVALREACLYTRLNGRPHQVIMPLGTSEITGDLGVLNHYDCATQAFRQSAVSRGQLTRTLAKQRQAAWLGIHTPHAAYHLQTRFGWQQHPTMLLTDTSGEVRAYIWPCAPVMGLEFSQGMAITRDIFLLTTPKDLSAERRHALVELLDRPAIAMTSPAWFAESDLLLPLFQADQKRFPFFEKLVSEPAMMGPLTPENIESRKMYGLFDYGDCHGAGGWSNLESFVDQTMIMQALRSGDAKVLRQGFISARHYRDMDINHVTGLTPVHNPNHVIGTPTFSHSWPQGVYAHYLTTGSRRSLEVSLQTGEALLRYPVAGGLDGGGRVLARFLTATADIYQVTGDERYRERFMTQLERAMDLLKQKPDKPDQSIFGRRTMRLRPYQGWYGCMALIRMYRLTGDKLLLRHLRREVPETMKMDLYRLDLEELWPGLPPEQGRPIMCADFARHRGALMFPVLVQYANLTGERKWADLALRALYAGAVYGQMVKQPQELLASAALAACPPDVTEDQLVREARELLWNAAAPTIANGDFTRSTTHWHHWRTITGKSLSYHDNYTPLRKRMLKLDPKVFKVNAPSLRFELSRSDPRRRRIFMDSARFRLAPGAHRFSAWVKTDDNAGWVSVKFCVSTLDARRATWMDFRIERDRAQPEVRNATPCEIKSCTVAPPDKNGWRRVTFEFRVPKRCLAVLFIAARIARGENSHTWVDGISLAPTGP